MVWETFVCYFLVLFTYGVVGLFVAFFSGLAGSTLEEAAERSVMWPVYPLKWFFGGIGNMFNFVFTKQTQLIFWVGALGCSLLRKEKVDEDVDRNAS